MREARLGRFRLSICVVAALLVPAVSAARPGASLVAVITTDPGAEVSHRVQEQLEALGLDVVVLNPPATGSVGPTALQQAARNVGAIAAVRIVPLAQSVQVWTADPVSGQSVFRELIPPSGTTPSDASVALGAVELLRAAMIELHPPAPPPPPPEPRVAQVACPPPPPAPAAPGTKRTRLSLATGPGLDVGLSGRPAAAWSVAVWVALFDRLGVRALGVLDFVPGQIASPSSGNIAVSAQLFGADLTYDMMPSDQLSVPAVGAGVLVANVVARGVDAGGANAVNLYNSVWTALPFVRVGEALRVLPDLRARADALGGYAPARIDVCVRQNGQCSAAGHWGRPFVDVTLSMEVQFSP
jgi:hypothetical protein